MAAVKKYGCYLMSVIYLTCKNGGYDTARITSDFVIKIYRMGIDRKALDRNCTVLLPTALSQLIAEQLNLKKHVVLLQALRKKITTEMPAIFDKKRYIIGMYAYMGMTHFIVMGRTGHEYDPLGGTSRTAREGVLAGLRIYATSSA